MKPLFTLMTMMLLFHASVSFAENECDGFKKASDLLESIKNSKHEVVGNDVADFYKKTNKELEQFVDTTCEVGLGFGEIISESSRMCKASCVKHSKVTKGNSKKFLRSCSTVCDKTRASQNAYKKLMDEKKKNADVVMPTKESISNLKREAKELGLDMDGNSYRRDTPGKVNSK